MGEHAHHRALVDPARPRPPRPGTGAASRPPPRRRAGTASRSRTPAARVAHRHPVAEERRRSGPPRRRSRSRRRRASAAAARTSVTNTLISSPRRWPSWPYVQRPVRPAASRPRTSSATASSGRSEPSVPGSGPRRPAAGRRAGGRPGIGSGVRDHGRHRHRPAGRDVGGDLAQLRERLAVDPLHEDVDDAAAGQPDRERVVVADAVPLQHRRAGRRRTCWPARTPRPRRSRRTRCRPPRRPGRPASPHPAGRGRERAPRCRPTVARPPPARPAGSTTCAPSPARHASRDHLQSPANATRLCPATNRSRYGRAATMPRLHRLVPGLAAMRVQPDHRVGEPGQPVHLLAEQGRVAALPAVAAHQHHRPPGHPALAPAVQVRLQYLAEPGPAGPVRHHVTGRAQGQLGVAVPQCAW